MPNYNNRNNYNRGSNVAVKIVAMILVVVLGLAYVAVAIWKQSWNPVKWISNEQVQPGDDNNNGDNNGDNNGGNVENKTAVSGMTVIPSESSALMALSATLMSDEVSALSENSYTLTATISSDDGLTRLVNWDEVSFANPSSEWATGKTVTDYVTVTPTTDGANTAVISCLQEFGEPIIIKASVRGQTDLYATCTAHYVQRLFNTDFKMVCTYKPCALTWNLTGNNINPSVDFPTSTYNQDWAFAYGNADSTLTTASMTNTTSSVYTKPIYDEGHYTFSVAPTQAYINAITAAGLTTTATAENYTEIAFSQVNFYTVLLFKTVNFTMSNDSTFASQLTALKTALSANADSDMLRIKIQDVFYKDDGSPVIHDTVYNVKFNAESFTFATDITFDKDEIEF